MWTKLSGAKTYIAAGVGLCAGAGLLYTGEYEHGAAFITGSLGLVGLGHKAEKALEVLKQIKTATAVTAAEVAALEPEPPALPPSLANKR